MAVGATVLVVISAVFGRYRSTGAQQGTAIDEDLRDALLGQRVKQAAPALGWLPSVVALIVFAVLTIGEYPLAGVVFWPLAGFVGAALVTLLLVTVRVGLRWRRRFSVTALRQAAGEGAIRR